MDNPNQYCKHYPTCFDDTYLVARYTSWATTQDYYRHATMALAAH